MLSDLLAFLSNFPFSEIFCFSVIFAFIFFMFFCILEFIRYFKNRDD